jgi:hypothetical protein
MRGMSFSLPSHLKGLVGYILFIGCLGWTALTLGHRIAEKTLILVSHAEEGSPAAPSRVERFILGQIAARKAPQVPVPRSVTALNAPDIPVALLASRLDRAESVPQEVLRLPAAEVIKVLDEPDVLVAVLTAKVDDLKDEAIVASISKTRDTSQGRSNKDGRPLARAQAKVKPFKPLAQKTAATNLYLVSRLATDRPVQSATTRDILHRSLGAVIFVN